MYVTDVPVADRMVSRERYELETAYAEMWEAHNDVANALEDVSEALVKAGWPALEAETSPHQRLLVTVDRLDAALALNGYSV